MEEDEIVRHWNKQYPPVKKFHELSLKKQQLILFGADDRAISQLRYWKILKKSDSQKESWICNKKLNK